MLVGYLYLYYGYYLGCWLPVFAGGWSSTVKLVLMTLLL